MRDESCLFSECAQSDAPYAKFIMPDNATKFYDLLTVPFETATDVEKQFWKWLMLGLCPIVSKDWYERLKGKKIIKINAGTKEPEPEETGDYLTCSDFAYIPMVIKIYGKRELDLADGDKRVKGRTKGQSGMVSRESIAQYVESMLKMKSVLDNIDNALNIAAWSEAAIGFVENLDETFESVEAISEASRVSVEQDMRRTKKDDIPIPV